MEDLYNKQLEQVELVLKEQKENFKIIDLIDEELKSSDGTPSFDQILLWSRKVCGAGNSIDKQLGKYQPLIESIENTTFSQLQLNSTAVKFVVASAKEESKKAANSYRELVGILEHYVRCTERILSICRLHQNSIDLNTKKFSPNL